MAPGSTGRDGGELRRRRHGGSVPLGALGETTCRTPQHRPTEGQEARHPVPHLEGGPCLFIPGLLQLLEKGARPEVPEVASGVRRCLLGIDRATEKGAEASAPLPRLVSHRRRDVAGPGASAHTAHGEGPSSSHLLCSLAHQPAPLTLASRHSLGSVDGCFLSAHPGPSPLDGGPLSREGLPTPGGPV